MEQQLFESDRIQSTEIFRREYYMRKLLSNENKGYYTDGFQDACSYKNNQMQEFDKWKERNNWHLDWIRPEDIEKGIYRRDLPRFKHETKSFSELFEIFIKETSK